MIRLVLIALVLASLGGCKLLELIPEGTPDAVPVVAAWREEPEDGRPTRRVIVLPFQDRTGQDGSAELCRGRLADELQKRQLFEVVTVTADELAAQGEQDFFETGLVRKETILRLAATHGADGILYGALTRYRAYEPMIVGLRVELVSAGAGDVIWSVNGYFDAGDVRISQDVHNYHDTQLAGNDSLHGWRSVLLSPTRFATYAGSRIADTYENPTSQSIEEAVPIMPHPYATPVLSEEFAERPAAAR